MGGIATVTLNAALDRTLHVDRLDPGGKSRVLHESCQAGGKGVNVSRVLAALGHPTRAIVAVGGVAGRAITADLERSGLASQRIDAAGESRTCLEIVEPGGRALQLHGPGIEAGESLVDAVARAVASLPEDFAWLALCGSLPPGAPPGALATLLRAGRRRGLRVALDASGEALAAAWAEGPDLVRVNDVELAGVLPAGEPDEPPWACLGPARRGVVSRGPLPFDSWTEGTYLRVTPPEVDAVNAIGCGDAMLAALLASLEAGASFDAALRRGTALAAAQACARQAGRPDTALARSLESRVRIEPWRGPRNETRR